MEEEDICEGEMRLCVEMMGDAATALLDWCALLFLGPRPSAFSLTSAEFALVSSKFSSDIADFPKQMVRVLISSLKASCFRYFGELKKTFFVGLALYFKSVKTE